MANLKPVVCPEHGSTCKISSTNLSELYTHITFECNNTLELSNRPTRVGDIVRYENELFRVDDIFEGVAILINTTREVETFPDRVEYVGADVISGLGADSIMKDVQSGPAKWTPLAPTIPKTPSSYKPNNYSYAPTQKRQKPKTKPKRADSISTGSLINHEVKKLKSEGQNTTKPLRTKPPTRRTIKEQPKDDEEETKKIGPPIPKRKGDW